MLKGLMVTLRLCKYSVPFIKLELSSPLPFQAEVFHAGGCARRAVVWGRRGEYQNRNCSAVWRNWSRGRKQQITLLQHFRYPVATEIKCSLVAFFFFFSFFN